MKFSTEHAVKSFPNSLEKDVLSLFAKITLQNDIYHTDIISILFQGETLEIIGRVYFEVRIDFNLTEIENLILDCLLTRHSDGFVRQKSLQKIILSNQAWVIPFVFQLLGEYVVEILQVIKDNLNKNILDNFINLIKENPLYFEKTEHRIVSYWHCYYRGRFPQKEDYVGFQILEAIKTHK